MLSRRILLASAAILWPLLVSDGDASQPAMSASPPVAVPAFVDVTTFRYVVDGQNHKVTVTTCPSLLRVDEVDDELTILYDPQTQFYTGLENKNATYWNFSWPQVSSAVQVTRRYESRLQQLGNEGLNGDLPPPTTNAASAFGPSSAPAPSSDDSGYVWQPTTEHRRIAGLDCVRWTGDTVSGESIEAWCSAGVIPQVRTAIARLHEISAPMALVPIRSVAPDIIFPAYDALMKGGVTPLEISWGDAQNRNHFDFVETRQREGKLSMFTVPKLYLKTTLATMDPVGEPRKK